MQTVDTALKSSLQDGERPLERYLVIQSNPIEENPFITHKFMLQITQVTTATMMDSNPRLRLRTLTHFYRHDDPGDSDLKKSRVSFPPVDYKQPAPKLRDFITTTKVVILHLH